MYAKTLYTSVLCTLLVISIQAQSKISDESVILYNSEAVRVELSEIGKILNFKGLATGYMDGYEMPSTLQPLEKVNFSSLESESKSGLINAEYAILSPEKVDLPYKEESTILSRRHLGLLTSAIAKIKQGKERRLLITTFSDTPSLISSNRLNALITYLSINGITKDKLVIESKDASSLKDIIRINFLR